MNIVNTIIHPILLREICPLNSSITNICNNIDWLRFFFYLSFSLCHSLFFSLTSSLNICIIYYAILWILTQFVAIRFLLRDAFLSMIHFIRWKKKNNQKHSQTKINPDINLRSLVAHTSFGKSISLYVFRKSSTQKKYIWNNRNFKT